MVISRSCVISLCYFLLVKCVSPARVSSACDTLLFDLCERRPCIFLRPSLSFNSSGLRDKAKRSIIRPRFASEHSSARWRGVRACVRTLIPREVKTRPRRGECVRCTAGSSERHQHDVRRVKKQVHVKLVLIQFLIKIASSSEYQLVSSFARDDVLGISHANHSSSLVY